jgi:hypothetical protein
MGRGGPSPCNWTLPRELLRNLRPERGLLTQQDGLYDQRRVPLARRVGPAKGSFCGVSGGVRPGCTRRRSDPAAGPGCKLSTVSPTASRRGLPGKNSGCSRRHPPVFPPGGHDLPGRARITTPERLDVVQSAKHPSPPGDPQLARCVRGAARYPQHAYQTRERIYPDPSDPVPSKDFGVLY